MTPRASTALVAATGHDYAAWFDALDAWDAASHSSAEARAWLRDRHGLSTWWAQKLVVEYEQARGRRVPGVRPDGTVTVGTTRTVDAPPSRVFAAIVDEGERKGWLRDLTLELRTSSPDRRVRFDGPDGTRVHVVIEPATRARTTVSVEQHGLPLDVDRETVRSAWAARLDGLRAALLVAHGPARP